MLHRKESIAHRVWKDWDLYLLLIPGFIWYLLFCYKPMVGLRTAFYDYNVFRGFAGSTFVGFANFRDFIDSPDFIRTIKNTLLIAFWQMAICFPVPIILAVAITEMKCKFVSKLTQTATFLPYFISVVVVCGMVVSFLSPSTGIINRRSELAAMECVGMTRGQLRKLALVECLQYVIIACVGAIVLSLALLAGTQFFLRSIQLIEDNSERLVEFSEPVIRVLIAGAGAFVAALAASLIPLKEMQRTDLVDRIRTLE